MYYKNYWHRLEKETPYTITYYLGLTEPDTPELIISDFKRKNFPLDQPINLAIQEPDFFLDSKLADFFKNRNVPILHIAMGGTWPNNIKPKSINPQQLLKFKNIYSLGVRNTPQFNPTLDLSSFTNLVQLSTDSIKHFINIDKTSLKALQIQTLANRNQLSADISKVRLPSSLEYLCLNSQKMTTLNGLENLENLEELNLFNMRTLTDISAIGAMKKLKHIQMQGCPNIDFNTMPFNQSLENLILINKVNSIKFIEKLPNLKNLKFLKGLEDGDLSPLKGRIFDNLDYRLKPSGKIMNTI